MEYYTQSTRQHDTISQLVPDWHFSRSGEPEYIQQTDQTRIPTQQGWEGEVYNDVVMVPGDRTADPEAALMEHDSNYAGSTGPHGPVGVGGAGFPIK